MKIMINKKQKAFSLVEVVVASFVFAVVMVGVAGAFSSSFFSYKNGKKIQQDLEQAQFVMSLMAKMIRTSSVIAPASAGNVTDLKVYDYSQGKCMEYKFNSATNELEMGSATPTDSNNPLTTCPAITTTVITTKNLNNVNFYASPSTTGSVGKVTISMEICSTSGCLGSNNDRVRLQTTVSLRDFEEVGI